MSPRRLCVVVALCAAWLLCDGAPATRCVAGCLLCLLAAPLLRVSGRREGSTQTDGGSSGRPPQEPEEGGSSGDLSQRHPEPPESQYPLVKTSLRQVFECAYAQLLLPWYGIPEPRRRQPLHQVLSGELDFVFDRVIERAKGFDVCQAVVGCVRILTQHLHNAKQSDREPSLSSRVEEVADLRKCADALVRDLFHESLWGHKFNRCALTEIVALKGLGLLVSWLSDPDTLNQLVVSHLDSATPTGSVEELCGSDSDQTSPASKAGKDRDESLAGAGLSTGRGITTKRKANKLKEGWSKFVEKVKCKPEKKNNKKKKSKKMKTVEQSLILKAMSINRDTGDDAVGSTDGSVLSMQDSDGDDSDLEDYLTSVKENMMEFKLSYEMWRVGRWAVSIPHADWEEEALIFTVHLEEEKSPENLQWDIRKTYMDVVHFRNRWQDSTSLPTIPVLDKSTVEAKEEARVSVEQFLQALVSDNLIGLTQPVFQFLCPLDKLLNEEELNGGVWGLLSGLAYFLTPGEEEEEVNIGFTACNLRTSSSPQTEAAKEMARAETPDAFSEEGSEVPGSSIPTFVISQHGSPPEWPEEAETPPAIGSDTLSGNGSKDKTEDSDKLLTFRLKNVFKGLTRSRSQESLASTKNASDEDPPDSDPSPRGGRDGDSQERPEGLSLLHFSGRANKKERTCFKISGGAVKTRGKHPGTLPRGEEAQGPRSQVNCEQLEATKAIFDLLKEISGKLINLFELILKPMMPLLKKKVNSFLNKLKPTEVQMAALIDAMREKQWPDIKPATAAAPPPHLRTDEQKNETRERAHNLINAKYSNYLVLKKTDVETVFNIFQNSKENKLLLHMLLSFLLKEFLPSENSPHASAAAP
ncbi:uncharacterized protein AB9W97_005650 isoform 2-T3 [Spinachia spinachia]